MANIKEWLTIDKTSGTGNAQITLSASSYEELVERTATIKVQGISTNAILTIRQEALVPTITFSQGNLYFGHDGGVYLDTIVTSNVEWDVKYEGDWFYISHIYGGDKGETTFRVEVTENLGNNRNGAIDFLFNGNVIATLYITQYGVKSFEKDVMSFGYNAETQTNKVLNDASWYIVTDGDWFTVTPSNNNGVSNISVRVNDNDGARRVGSISLYATEGDFYLGSIIVGQASEMDSQYLWLETAETDGLLTSNPTIMVSYDGNTWTEGNYINLGQNKIVYMKKKDNDDRTNQIAFNKNYSVGGNVSSMGSSLEGLFEGQTKLLDASELDVTSLIRGPRLFMGCTNLKYPPKTLGDGVLIGTFHKMFQGCESLVVAPKLPATTLYYDNNNGYGDGTHKASYADMFYGCTSLTEAPDLPATSIESLCYSGMFAGCTSLTKAPALPATILADGCYSGMFENCHSLVNPPTLSATTLATECYKGMFASCKFTNAPDLPATILAERCYADMFYNCTNLTTPPVLAATTLARSCCSSMFYNCINLTTTPILKAEKLEISCYDTMFKYCSNLNYIKMLAYDGFNNFGVLNDWVVGVQTKSGTFIKHPDADLPSGESGIPSNWTVETATE